MRRRRAMMLRCSLVMLLCCTTLWTGCNPASVFGSNFSLSVLIPSGFGGTPGLLNPFGITQAIVNALLGIGGSTATDDSSGGSGAAAPSFAPDPGTIGAIVS